MESMAKRSWNRFLALFCIAVAAACSPQSAVATNEASAAGAPVVRAASAAPSAPVIKASASAFEVTSVLTPDRPIRHGDFIWNEDGVAPGPRAIVVDVQTQVVYVYRGGVEIGRSAILYGADDKPTPTGSFKILQKKRHHVSNLYGAPMPYMMRLTMDGIAIHASDVKWGNATHGCVGVPNEFAAKLFKEAQLGDQVLITKGWMAQLLRKEAAKRQA
jgi:lipoprotein-anchoring transpeptidase ErfK/SrfK